LRLIQFHYGPNCHC